MYAPGGHAAADTSADGRRDDPSPLPGLDMRDFRNLLVRALAGDELVPPALLTRVNDALRERGEEARKRDTRWWEDLFWKQSLQDRLREIDALIGRYQDMADWHHDQAELARSRMQEATDKLGEIDEFIDGADDIIDKSKEGKLDREKAIALLKSRGVEVDPDEDDSELIRKLTMERIKAREERLKWIEQYERSKSDAYLHDKLEEENRRKARELIERREVIRAGGYGVDEQTRRLREVSDEYSMAVRVKADEIEVLKASEAGRLNEAQTARAESAAGSQTEDEEADFLAAANALTGTFERAASNQPPEMADEAPAMRRVVAPTPSA